jgi:predicted phosphate transport protein (TIGR00153 family)
MRMGLFKKGKEQEVAGMIIDLLKKVHVCIEETQKTVSHYLRGDIGNAKSSALKADHAETETDYIRRTIVDALYRGAFLPIFRVEIHNFVEKVDVIADTAENCCNFFLGQRPEIPEEFKERFLKVINDTLPMSRCLKESTENFFTQGDHEFIKKSMTQIGISESAIDDDEWKLTRDLFTSDLPLAEKMHLKRCLEKLTSISDQIEDTSDLLEVLLISTKV